MHSLTHSRTSLPLISNPPASTHLTQTLLVLQRKLPIAHEIIFAAAAVSTARHTADIREGGEFARVAFESPRAVRPR